MKMELLSDSSPDCPLIRLFEFTSEEARQLLNAVLGLAHDVPAVAMHRLPFVNSINGCRLTLQTGEWDQGILLASEAGGFVCSMTTGTWENVATLIEPFVFNADGYQWLATVPGEARLLLSRTGEW